MARVYVPGGTLEKMYLPDSLVVAVRERFVCVSVRVTAAPATAPPDRSVTVPSICPVPAICENKADGLKTNK